MKLDSFFFHPFLYSTKCVPKGQDGLVIVIKQGNNLDSDPSSDVF